MAYFKKKSSSAGDSGSIYQGSQPAPKITPPSGPPPQVGGLITGPSTGSVSDMVGAVTRYSSGGTSSNNANLERARQEAQRLAQVEAQRKAQEDALRRQTEQAKLEQQKIENLRRAILEKGAQERERISRNAANERIRTTTTEIQRIQNGKSTNALVWKYENLDTGETRYRSYEVPKGGGGRRLSGGVDGFQEVATPKETLKKGTQYTATLEAYQRPKGGLVSEFLQLGKISSAVKNYANSIRVRASVGRATQTEQAKLLASGFVGGLTDTVIGLVDLPQTLTYLARNPREITKIPSNIATAGANFGYIMTLNPSEGIAYIGGSLVGIKGTNAAIKGISKVGNKVLTRLNPKFVGDANIGKTLKIKVAPGRTVSVKVVGKIPKQTFAQQINLAGKKVSAISSQADDMFRLLSKKRVVRKPIPGEARFNTATKNLLKKFDAGKITRTELSKLDALIKKQRAKGLLERSFFADPSGKIRPSRLGIAQDRAGIMDYLSGDVTFKRAKPQIFLFDDIQVAKFPRNLQSIAKKLKAGRPINRFEANRILEWQLKQSGKFKPLGFVSGESEIVLAPGEILRKVKRVGVTLVNGKKVPIWKVEVFRPKGITKNLLNKLATGKITNAQRLRLKRLLQRQTGINYASSYSPSARYVNVRYLGYNSLGRLSVRLSRTGSGSRVLRSPISRGSSFRGSRLSGGSKVSRGSPRSSSRVSRVSRGSPLSRASSGRTSRGSSRGGSSGRSYGGSRRVPPKIPIRFKTTQGFRPQQLSKTVPTFYVVEKVRGKFKKLYPKPLSLTDARDYAVYSIDNNLSRTAFFIPLGRAKRVVRPPKTIQNYASKNRFKVRPYRIRFGKRRQLVNGFIEKRKYFQDTLGERRSLRSLRRTPQRQMPRKRMSMERRKQLIRQLQKARAIRMRQMGTRVRPSGRRVVRPVRRMVRPVRRSRIITPTQRRELLRRLKKARAVRMRMLRRRR